MKIGDIVRLKKEHHLSEIFDVNCIVYEKSNFQKITGRKPRYHIKTMTGELKWCWVYESEVDMISNIRTHKLEQLGI